MKDVFKVEGIDYEEEGVILVLNNSGDIKITWNRKNETEVAYAREEFKKLTQKGWAAFSVGKLGKKTKKITEFNPGMNKIILVSPVAGGKA